MNFASLRQALGIALTIFPSLDALRRAGAISARTASLQPIGPHVLLSVSFAGHSMRTSHEGVLAFPAHGAHAASLGSLLR